MPPKLASPEKILPTRMTLHVPPDTPLRFSTLDFPYKNALNRFMSRFEAIYKQQHDQELPYSLKPPYRQLNDAILALAPGLIQAFEGQRGLDRMVTFTQYDEHDLPEDFPSWSQLQSLIRHWLERWAEQTEIQAILQGDGKRVWQELIETLHGDPETEWRHDIAPADLVADPTYERGLAYDALPALIATRLEKQTMVIQSERDEYRITWRRVNTGGKNGLHIISQPILFDDDYFAYRLEFSVETQAGYVDNKGNSRPWIFAHLSIQRYITQRYRGGDNKRNISVLVGFNREQFAGGWDNETTLIRLAIKKNGDGWQWASGVSALLNEFAVRPMASPDDILNTPHRYGNYDGLVDFAGDEYYVVFAEGRKFSDDHERGRRHQVETGTSLRERSQIMENVLSLLDGWLEVSPTYQRDMQIPLNSFALRDYNYMVDPKRQNNTKQYASWRTMLETSLANSGHTHLHIAVLHRSPDFEHWSKAQIEEALMGVDAGDNPLVTVSYVPLQPSLYFPLDPGGLDPQMVFKKSHEKPAGFMEQWNTQMRESYPKKRDEWRTFLQGIPWQPNARRLVLIDSTGESDTPDTQKIKGAVRDACNREGVLSQFIVGDLQPDAKKPGKLKGESAGRLKHAVLDLLLRQQAILYAPPHEIYERTARLDAEIARNLDIVAFCRVKRTGLCSFNYVLAVRLRADGTVHIMLSNDSDGWIPYDIAAQKVGILISKEHVSITNNRKVSPLRMKHDTMLNFVHDVLTKWLERPTIAVIEAEDWRNGAGQDEKKHCWTQLRNGDLSRNRHVLRFDRYRTYERAAPALDNLLAVVRLRMDDETPQYITAADWTAEDPMRDIPHLTSYIDPCVTAPLHFMSVARLPETQKKQKEKQVVEAFKGDIPARKQDDIPYKHPQLIEMVPFFVHPDFRHDEGQRQLCRCVHFLRNSPGFVMGAITLPYPMHLGEKLVEDQLCIIDADA